MRAFIDAPRLPGMPTDAPLLMRARELALAIDRRLPGSRWSTSRLVFKRLAAVRCAVLDGQACAHLAPATRRP